jgi:hypothetical protein
MSLLRINLAEIQYRQQHYDDAWDIKIVGDSLHEIVNEKNAGSKVFRATNQIRNRQKEADHKRLTQEKQQTEIRNRQYLWAVLLALLGLMAVASAKTNYKSSGESLPTPLPPKQATKVWGWV